MRLGQAGIAKHSCFDVQFHDAIGGLLHAEFRSKSDQKTKWCGARPQANVTLERQGWEISPTITMTMGRWPDGSFSMRSTEQTNGNTLKELVCDASPPA